MLPIDYDFHIKSAFEALSDGSITFRDVIDELHDVIVDCYNGDVFSEYKKGWHQAVNNYAEKKEIEFASKTRSNWERISGAIVDRLVANGYDFQKPARNRGSVSGESSATRQSCGSVRESVGSSSGIESVSSSSSDISNKQIKLNPEDKARIKRTYDGLDKQKMWKLSTGTIVEDQMRDVALNLDYEHPSHSLILNITDTCWKDAFTKEEIDEIRAYRSIELPAMSVEVRNYLDELNALGADQLYKKVDSGVYDIVSDSSWLQKTYRDAYRLLESDFFPIESQTEGNLLKRMWTSLDSCFDFGVIKSVSGEKCSKASADASNKDRCLSDVGRQSSGRKMDYLFTAKKNGFEVGCGECALVGGVRTTKELIDAGLKMPKVMRDMANSILATHTCLVNNLCITGYYIGADAIQLLTLDFPAGYVARLDGFGPAVFPKNQKQISSLEHVVQLILSGKILMENLKRTIDECKMAPLSRLGHVSSFIVPTFSAVVDKKKKRKVGEL